MSKGRGWEEGETATRGGLKTLEKWLGVKYEEDRNKERATKEGKHIFLSACVRTQINGNNNGKMTVIKKRIGRRKMEDEYKQGWWYYLVCFSQSRRAKNTKRQNSMLEWIISVPRWLCCVQEWIIICYINLLYFILFISSMRFLSRACVMLVSDHSVSIDARLQRCSKFSGFGTNAHNFGRSQMFQDVWSVDILRSFSTLRSSLRQRH